MQSFILPAITGAKKCPLFLDDIKFLDSISILTKSLEHEIQVKGTGSRCGLEVCIMDNYCSRFSS